MHASPTEGRLIKTTRKRREERERLHCRSHDFRYMPLGVLDLWSTQPRETFWYKMLLKELESVDSLERMDKTDEARCGLDFVILINHIF